MTVQAEKVLSSYLPEGLTVELRKPDRSLADSSLPYLEAWRLCVARKVEGKITGGRLRYLRLLDEKEQEVREPVQRADVESGGGCLMPSNLRLGVQWEALREAVVQADSFGCRVVVAEGDVTGHVYSFCLANGL